MRKENLLNLMTQEERNKRYVYTFTYFNKYQKKELTCSYSAGSKKEALKMASTNITEADGYPKWINEKYKPSDFTLVATFKQVISLDKEYKTVSGKKVTINNLNRKTNSANIVKGTILTVRKNKKDLIETCYWTLNGFLVSPGIPNKKDLIEVL